MSKTILVVDDEEAMREIFSSILKRDDYEILLAENGKQALEVFTVYSEEIDLVVLDVIMPEMNGISFFREIRKIRTDIRVLFCTGSSFNDPDFFKNLPEGTAVIMKPCRLNPFVKKVKELLGDSG